MRGKTEKNTEISFFINLLLRVPSLYIIQIISNFRVNESVTKLDKRFRYLSIDLLLTELSCVDLNSRKPIGIDINLHS